MTTARFDIDRLRLEVAHGLPAHCFDDFQRLTRSLLHGPQFQWLLVDAPDEALRREVMAALATVLKAAGLTTNRLPIGRQIIDVPTLEARLIKNAQRADVVHLLGPPGWFDSARWDAFNVRRERIAAAARARLVFWLDAAAIASAAQGAPDLWAWRGGVYAFVPQRAPAPDAGAALTVFSPPADAGHDPRSMAQRHRRIAEIEAWLEAHPRAPDDLLVAPFDELGRLLYDCGDFDGALAHWHRRELPLHRRRGSERDAAVTLGQIADILQIRGELDEALRIRREDELPVYERLGDMRARAITMGRIADVLQARGELDEALRIRREDQLPVYERIGDMRARAVTMGKIADVLQARGDFDEALRIRREDELPVYERLGDMRARAITMGRIADVLQARGELDEALRIRREDQLPAYERLGDIRARAITMGKIADVLQARGELDEALRIRREDELPVFARLGDMRAQAVTMGKIANALQARGELDEALRIRRDDQLPVFERLGDRRELAITQAQIGMQLWDRDEREPAERHFRQALAQLAAMRLPEARTLEQVMRSRGLDPG